MRVVVPPVTSVEPTVRLIAAPAGVAHTPSPRQKVVAPAEDPEFKWEVARFPVTPVERGRLVPFARLTADGVPRSGVTKIAEVSVGDVEKTRLVDVVPVAPDAV